MTSSAHSAIRSLSVLIVLSLFPTLFIAQNKVVIKERVELGRQTALSAGGDELEFVVRWMITNPRQYPERFSNKPVELFVVDSKGIWGGYNAMTDERSANYSVTVDSTGSGYSTIYSGVSQFTTTSVCSPVFGIDVYVDTNVIWNVGYLMFVVEVYHSWELDTSYSFLDFYDSYGYVPETTYRGFFTDYHPDIICETPPVAAHYVITEMGDVIQHGEVNYISIAAVDNEGVRITPPETRVQLAESSAPWGYLEDFNSAKQGKVLDSLTMGSYNERELYFWGWGKEPDAPKELTFTISSYDGSLPPVQATFTLLPPEVRAIPGRSVIPYGDTTSLLIQARQQGAPWMDKPPDWKVEYWIAQADTFGFLYNADSTKTGTYFDDYSSRMNYSSNPETEPDSVEVLIAMYIHEPCYDCEGGGASKISSTDILTQKSGPQQSIQARIREQRKKQNIDSRLSKVTVDRIQQNQILSKIRGQNSSLPTSAATSSRYIFDEHFGLARIVLKKQGCIQVQHATLYVGDTTTLSFVYEETGQPVPADKRLDVLVSGGSSGANGIILANGSSGISVNGATQPIKYIAPAEISENELVVQIVAVESESVGGPLARILQETNANQSGRTILSKTNTISPRIISALKAQGTPASCPLGTMTIDAYPPCQDKPIKKIEPYPLNDHTGCSVIDEKVPGGSTSTRFGDVNQDGLVVSVCFDHSSKIARLQTNIFQAQIVYGICNENLKSYKIKLIHNLGEITQPNQLCSWKNELEARISLLQDKNRTNLIVPMQNAFAFEPELINHELKHVEQRISYVELAFQEITNQMQSTPISPEEAKRIDKDPKYAKYQAMLIQNKIESKYKELKDEHMRKDELDAQDMQRQTLIMVLQDIKSKGINCN